MQLDLFQERDRHGWCHTCPCGQVVKDPQSRIHEWEERRVWHLVCWVAAGRGTAAQGAIVERMKR